MDVYIVLELEVAFLLGVCLDELLKHRALVPAELTELAILEIDDRVAHLVEEAGVVRSGNHRAAALHERPQPVLQPLDVRDLSKYNSCQRTPESTGCLRHRLHGWVENTLKL